MFPWEQGCRGICRVSAALAGEREEEEAQIRERREAKAVFWVWAVRRGGLVLGTGCGTHMGQSNS